MANLVGIVSYQQKLELNMNLYGSTKYYSDVNTKEHKLELNMNFYGRSNTRRKSGKVRINLDLKSSTV